MVMLAKVNEEPIPFRLPANSKMKTYGFIYVNANEALIVILSQ